MPALWTFEWARDTGWFGIKISGKPDNGLYELWTIVKLSGVSLDPKEVPLASRVLLCSRRGILPVSVQGVSGSSGFPAYGL